MPATLSQKISGTLLIIIGILMLLCQLVILLIIRWVYLLTHTVHQVVASNNHHSFMPAVNIAGMMSNSLIFIGLTLPLAYGGFLIAKGCIYLGLTALQKASNYFRLYLLISASCALWLLYVAGWLAQLTLYGLLVSVDLGAFKRPSNELYLQGAHYALDTQAALPVHSSLEPIIPSFWRTF